MYDAESHLWWYRILHEKVLEAVLSANLPKYSNILDAGCGTGGLLEFLKKNGFLNLSGFDFSEDAVAYCKVRNLKVSQANILDFTKNIEPKYDIIICNDVLYQFENEQIIEIFSQFFSILNPNGLIISNNQAFNIFGGMHDIAVGAKQRFVKADFEKILSNNFENYRIKTHQYWSLLLSPLILLVRVFQKIKLKLGLFDKENINSDVEVPATIINDFFYKIVKFEMKNIKQSFFGSSLFLTISNINRGK